MEAALYSVVHVPPPRSPFLLLQTLSPVRVLIAVRVRACLEHRLTTDKKQRVAVLNVAATSAAGARKIRVKKIKS